MAVELEAKMKVATLAGYHGCLESLGAEHVGQVVQRDHFFDRPDGSMIDEDCGLRLRRESGRGSVDSQLCFKGPRQEGMYKQRLEVEFTVGDANAAVQFLEAVGFVPTITYEKRRDVYHLHGCDVCLDEVVRLGCFVEIEGPDEQSVSKVRALLNLQDCTPILESYVSMLAALVDAEGTPLPVELLLDVSL